MNHAGKLIHCTGSAASLLQANLKRGFSFATFPAKQTFHLSSRIAGEHRTIDGNFSKASRRATVPSIAHERLPSRVRPETNDKTRG